MPDFTLPLFPEGSLVSSVITTTWVGVTVIAFFNLRFGWVLSGLVVPGYLVPLIIVKPWSAAVVAVESMVAYLLVRLVSDYLSRFGLWSSFFGRDRFFALILASVAVRLLFDAELLPRLGAYLNAELGIEFDYRNNLHSFGLVIISLMANQFWKPGLVRGFIPVAVTVAVTYVIIRYGLMEVTNFRISSLSYLYEDFAASVLASPKAYIILVVTAFLASRMNLRYGWDFNGTLIPALIALQYYQPLKILTSFVEALVIYALALLVLRLPLFANMTIEGARKILLFFNIGFFYKIALGFLLLWLLPEHKASDFFGFGYLLSTLIAVKVHDKEIMARLTQATLQTTVAGFALATAIGFLLNTATTVLRSAELEREAVLGARELSLPGTLAEQAERDRVALYAGRGELRAEPPLPYETAGFAAAAEELFAYVEDRQGERLTRARDQLREIGYDLALLEGRYLYLFDAGRKRPWGSFAIDLEAESELLVSLPAPLAQRGLSQATLHLFDAFGARALALGTAAEAGSVLPEGTETPFHAFHAAAGFNDVLQLRPHEVGSERGLPADQAPPAVLYVKGELPAGLDLVRLERLTGSYQVAFGAAPRPNRQRDHAWSGFAELHLHSDAVTRLSLRSLLPLRDEMPAETVTRRDAQLWALLGDIRRDIARRGSELYRAPSLEELLFFDAEVVTPLLRTLAAADPQDGFTEEQLIELGLVDAAARTLGYGLELHRDHGGKPAFLLLTERNQPAAARGYRGSYLFRIGAGGPFVVQAPRALSELNTLDYAISLYSRLPAQALLVGGAHPEANADGSADLQQLANRRSLLNLISQVLLREAGETPALIVQARGYARAAGEATPAAMLALSSGRKRLAELDSLERRLARALSSEGTPFQLVDGSRRTAGYEVGRLPQALYLDQTVNKGLAILWLSPELRHAYRLVQDRGLDAAHFYALNLEGEATVNLFDSLAEHLSAGRLRDLPGELTRSIDHYFARGDILLLRRLVTNWPAYRLRRIHDRLSGQTFLAIIDKGGALAAIRNVAPIDAALRMTVAAAEFDSEALERFVEERHGWMVITP